MNSEEAKRQYCRVIINCNQAEPRRIPGTEASNLRHCLI